MRIHALFASLMLATGCGTMWKNLQQQNSEWLDDAPPPAMVTRGPAVLGFLPLARNPERLRTWRVQDSSATVIPASAQLIDAYPIAGEWDHSRSESGAVIGRVGYMVVLYRDGETCAWVRGRYYETHMGAGSFGALDVADFNKYMGNDSLPEVARAERRHHFDCNLVNRPAQ